MKAREAASAEQERLRLDNFPKSKAEVGYPTYTHYVEELKVISEIYLLFEYPVCFRLLAAIPPLLAAVIVQDLGMIIDYTGLAAFAIAFLFPAILAKYSEVRCNEQGVNAFTVYSGFFTATVFRSMVILMATALISTVGFLLVYFQFIGARIERAGK